MAYHSHLEGKSSSEEADPTLCLGLTTSSSGYSSDEMLGLNDLQAVGHEARYNDFGLMEDFINIPASLALPETISPNDTLIDPYSAPPSGAFTNFSTPATSTFDSPRGYSHSTDPSPMFVNDSFEDDAADNFIPLFPENQEDLHALDATLNQGSQASHTTLPMSRESSSATHDIHHAAAAHSTRGPTTFIAAPPMSRHASTAAEDFDDTAATYQNAGRQTLMAAPQMSRKTSIPGQQSAPSSRQGVVRPPTYAGIQKQVHKPRKVLPDPEVDPADSEAVRRVRNTVAARKSRQKRADLIESLSNQVDYYRNIALSLGHVE